MLLTIYRYSIPIHLWNPAQKGLVVRIKNEEKTGWGEVLPLPGRSIESLDEALSQLLDLEKGFSGPLFNSVAFGLKSASLNMPTSFSWPAALFFMGSVSQILYQFETYPIAGFSHAKLKLKDLSLKDALFVTKKLKKHFLLRLDMNLQWSKNELKEFCSHFHLDDFDYIEDPGCDLSPFPVAYDELPPYSNQLEIWKPSVKGIPPSSHNIILGSSFESGIGLASIANLARHLSFPKVPLGIGTYHLLQEDLLETPLVFSQGTVTISSISPKMALLDKITEFRYAPNRYEKMELRGV